MIHEIGILRKGYGYFLELFRQQHSDILPIHLMFQKTLVIRGEKAARIFYDTTKFKRKKATPKRFKKTLFGKKGVQGLDDEKHLHRKAMFMECMHKDSLLNIQHSFTAHWISAEKAWKKQSAIPLFEETEKILFQTACDWMGIKIKKQEIGEKTKLLSLMIEGTGAIGLRHYQARKARTKAEKWLMQLVESIRTNPHLLEEDSILISFSIYKDRKGEFLPKKIVAVELLNLMRPIVAIARYIVFTAHALQKKPESKHLLTTESAKHNFIQEVRRFYPFFPFVAAKVRESFTWNETYFPKNCRVLLDLYATNHDEQTWKDADHFVPDRFNTWKENAFDFIPQGGGKHHYNHRCAGEWITILLMEQALTHLLKMDYTLLTKNLEIPLSRFPALPKEKFKIKVEA